MQMQFYFQTQQERDKCLVSEDFYDKSCILKAGIVDRDFQLIRKEWLNVKQLLTKALLSFHMRPVVYSEAPTFTSELKSYPFTIERQELPPVPSTPSLLDGGLFALETHRIQLRKDFVCLDNSIIRQFRFWRKPGCSSSEHSGSDFFHKLALAGHTKVSEVFTEKPQSYLKMEIVHPTLGQVLIVRSYSVMSVLIETGAIAITVFFACGLIGHAFS